MKFFNRLRSPDTQSLVASCNLDEMPKDPPMNTVSLMSLRNGPDMTIDLAALIRNTYRIRTDEPSNHHNRGICLATLEKCLRNKETANSGEIIKLTLAFMSIGFSPHDNMVRLSPFNLIDSINRNDSNLKEQIGTEEWFRKHYPNVEDFNQLRVAKSIMLKKLEEIEPSIFQFAGYYFLRAAIYFEIQKLQEQRLWTHKALIESLKNIMKNFDQLYNIYSQQLSFRSGASEAGKGVYIKYMTEADAARNKTENSSAQSIQEGEYKLYDKLVEAMEDKNSSLYAALIQLPSSSLKYLNEIKELTDYRLQAPAYEPPPFR